MPETTLMTYAYIIRESIVSNKTPWTLLSFCRKKSDKTVEKRLAVCCIVAPWTGQRMSGVRFKLLTYEGATR
jgi:hypothetical protein